ncbi:TlpA disulfide reductase family protein [Mucilaginibacter paludis]|uniref:Alkyl hydroperoxide reductase/ Thiol specific antioxidant/ Mal allergen n=1 Tax=Mucilaginibacter paludis DSM 18603 TaxID=714943 RepID=H1YA38_9SPHI|nr:TlpA disulfide reductase family protein [Mucilaginibacter paludis]EHQ25022.1 alkyl hydroperoxide reductase/ Thiol specific antioxidant/ Mal allergen [Mucilaginibacter paludis DSM 18603]
MLKKTFIALALLASSAHAQTVPGKVILKPEKPIQGKPLQVAYTPGKQNIDPTKTKRVFVYQFANFKWRVDTLPLQTQAGNLTAKINLDSRSVFVALKFDMATGPDHTHDTGYTWPVTDKKGLKLPGGALAQALFRMPASLGGPAGYFDKLPAQPSADTLQTLLKEEQEIKGSSPSRYAHTYISLQRLINGPRFKEEAPALLGKLWTGGGLSGQDSIELYHVYGFELKDETRAAELRKQIIERAPHSDFARLEAYQKAAKGVNNQQIIASSEKFLVDFPASEQQKNSPRQDYIYYGLYRNLAAAYFAEGKYDAIISKRKSWDFKTENEIYRWNIDRGLLLKTAPLAVIKPLADSLAEDLLTKMNDNSYREDFDAPADAAANAIKQMDDRIRTQITIHYSLGDNQIALNYFKKLSPGAEFANAETNAIHIQLLDRVGQSQAVKGLLEQCVRSNAVTPEMFARIKDIYTAEHKGLAGYEQYLASLKSADEVNGLKAEVKTHLLNHDIMPFALEDLNGNLVRSSDWEDKIVVIDFWATWCKPCIAAFPGMQMLVDKYAKDPRVDFYFVSTQQFGDYKQKVKDFIKREGWRFKVLFDGVNKETGAQDEVFAPLAKFFQSSGIPRKIIIKDGVMRYTNEGYSGSPSQLADELSYAIELLKSEK